MGKEEGDLWDDSLLISAFDVAISKYKRMHGHGEENKDSSILELETNNNENLASPILDSVLNDIRHLGIIDTRDSNASDATAEVNEVENLGADSLRFQDQARDHNSSIDEYNQLCKQYYEIEEQRQMIEEQWRKIEEQWQENEEQRQKILQKLQRFSGWNYTNAGEASVTGLQWGMNSANQEYQSSLDQAPCGAGIHSDDAPAPIAPGKLPGVEVADVVKTGLGAAERATSTFKDTSVIWSSFAWMPEVLCCVYYPFSVNCRLGGG